MTRLLPVIALAVVLFILGAMLARFLVWWGLPHRIEWPLRHDEPPPVRKTPPVVMMGGKIVPLKMRRGE